MVLRKHSSFMFCFIIIIHRKCVFKNLLYPWPWRTDEIIPWQRHQVKWFKLCMQLSISVFPQHFKRQIGITHLIYNTQIKSSLCHMWLGGKHRAMIQPDSITGKPMRMVTYKIIFILIHHGPSIYHHSEQNTWVIPQCKWPSFHEV